MLLTPRDLGLIDFRSTKHTDTHFYHALSDGRLRKLTPEIAIPADTYKNLTPWDQHKARIIAHGMSADRAVLVSASAAAAHGLPVPEVGGIVELGYQRGHTRVTSDPGLVYRGGAITPAEIIKGPGYRVTNLLRTLRDTARFHGPIAGTVVMDAACRRYSEVTPRSLRELLVRGQRYKGIRHVRLAIDFCDPNSESPLESRGRAILLLANLPEVTSIEVQAPITVNGRHYRVDLLVNGWLAIEFDGNIKYDGVDLSATLTDERWREKEIQHTGRVVRRFGAAHLKLRPDGGCTFLDVVIETLAHAREFQHNF